MDLEYRLVMRDGPTIGQIYPVDKPEMVIGRDLENDIVIHDSEISRRHARIFMQGSDHVIEDLGSTNGTFVNGQRLMVPYVLREGEIISFGEVITFVFETTVDTDATVVSAGLIEKAAPDTQPKKFPQAVHGSPVAYAGQIPDVGDTAEKSKKKIPMVLIIILIFLLLMCICGLLALWYIDANYLWCDITPWLFDPAACPQP
jgi:hypothetical protein